MQVGEAARPAAAGRRTDFASRLVDAVALVLLPALFLYSGLFQRYPIPGWVDPGIYLGYFFDLPGLSARYGFGATTYHGTRLSWVLPGYWLHQAFSPALAQQMLVALMYFPSIWAAWLAGRGLGGRLGGHLAAAFIAYSPLVLAAVGFGAVDGATVAYLLAAAACLFAPHNGRLQAIRLAAFGAFAMFAGVAHPFALPLAAFLALGFVVRAPLLQRSLLREAGCVLAGAVLAYLLLAVAGMAYGFRFWFPLDSVAMARRAVSGFGHNYRVPVVEWLFSSCRLLVPCLLLVALLAALRHAAPERRRTLLAAIVLLAASSTLFLLFDLLLGGLTLQVRNYTNLGLPACALALAALASRRTVDARMLLPIHLLIALPALLVAGAYGLRPDWLARPITQYAVFAMLLGAGGVAAFKGATNDTARAVRALIAFSLLLVGCGALNQDSSNVFVSRTRIPLKPAYLGAAALVDALRSEQPLADRQLLFWYPRSGFSTGDTAADRQLEFPLRFGAQQFRFTYFDTLSSLYLYDRSLLGDDFPRVDEARFMESLVRSPRPATIVLVSQREDDLPRALQVLDQRGWTATVVGTHRYEAEHFGYRTWILEACGRNLAASAGGRRCP